MVWGGDAARLQGLQRYLAAGNRPSAILAINEPNLRGQAFISPQATAQACDRIKMVADKYGIRLVGPNMALGSSRDNSITADDPIEHKPVTYAFMIPFLKATFFYAAKDDFSALAFHGYGNSGELHWATDLIQKEFAKPVWVTEFAEWHARGDAAERTYMIQAVDFLERNPNVQRYAWFKERVESNPMISLFENESGKLTPLGKAYVAMPVHDANLYYRIPGRLDSSKYVRVHNMEIAPSEDSDGFAEMRSTLAQGWVEYNIDPEGSGDYRLSVRLRGRGEFSVEQTGRTLGVGEVSENGWRTLELTAPLSAGAQTLRVQFARQSQTIEWIGISK
jgi:Glycosyl hydrolase catalytic core